MSKRLKIPVDEEEDEDQRILLNRRSSNTPNFDEMVKHSKLLQDKIRFSKLVNWIHEGTIEYKQLREKQRKELGFPRPTVTPDVKPVYVNPLQEKIRLSKLVNWIHDEEIKQIRPKLVRPTLAPLEDEPKPKLKISIPSKSAEAKPIQDRNTFSKLIRWLSENEPKPTAPPIARSKARIPLNRFQPDFISESVSSASTWITPNTFDSPHIVPEISLVDPKREEDLRRNIRYGFPIVTALGIAHGLYRGYEYMTNYKNNLEEYAMMKQRAQSIRAENARLESLRAERDTLLNEFKNTKWSYMENADLERYDRTSPRKPIRDPMEQTINEEYRRSRLEVEPLLEEFRRSQADGPFVMPEFPDHDDPEFKELYQKQIDDEL
jgi:hypothetical protein